MSLESRIERLEQQTGAKAEDLLIFVTVFREGIRPTEEELERLQKEAMEKNPGQRTHVIRWKPPG